MTMDRPFQVGCSLPSRARNRILISCILPHAVLGDQISHSGFWTKGRVNLYSARPGLGRAESVAEGALNFKLIAASIPGTSTWNIHLPSSNAILWRFLMHWWSRGDKNTMSRTGGKPWLGISQWRRTTAPRQPGAGPGLPGRSRRAGTVIISTCT